jgi:branched-chain amino acid aminotransferase
MKIYLDGNFVDKEDAKISVFDHGLLYGDGVFEGIRSYDSLIFKCEEHVDRLFETAESIGLVIPLSKNEMSQAIADTLKENNLTDAYIRVIVTRGKGDLGLDPKKCYGKPSVIIIADNIVLYPEEFYNNGMEIITVKTRRNHPEALHPKLKTLNYLNNILAKIEAGKEGYIEAIMLDYEGYVAECTGDNIFIVKDGKMVTPNRGILIGITRNAVMQIAKEEGILAEERLIKLDEVYSADECFLTGTAAEIIPVVKVDGKVIGAGRPGAVTKKMIALFKTATTKDGVKY